MLKTKEKSKKRPPRRGRLLVRILMFLLCIVLIQLLIPNLPRPDATLFLPTCDDSDFARFENMPPERMRLIENWRGETRVIAINSLSHDICYFTKGTPSWYSTTPATIIESPDQRYLAFTVSQELYPRGYLQKHYNLFIVNKYDGSYVHFSPGDDYSIIGDIAWSPDSSGLAVVSSELCSSGFHSCHSLGGYFESTVLISLLTPTAEILWRIDSGKFGYFYYGDLRWNQDGTQIIYSQQRSPRFDCNITVPSDASRDGWDLADVDFNCE